MPVPPHLAAERLGDAVDRRLRRAIGGVAGGMAEQAARRRHQDDLAAAALLQHLPAGGARHQPGLRDVGVHHVEEIVGLLIDDLRHLVLAGRDHQDVDAAERCRPRRRRCASQLASELGRLATIVDLARRAPRIRRRPSSARRRCWRQSTTLAPAPASTLAASAPNAPDAPVTIAVLPLTSNSESGFFRKSSDMVSLSRSCRSASCRASGIHASMLNDGIAATCPA